MSAKSPRNPVARRLRSPRFRSRIERKKTGYTRKGRRSRDERRPFTFGPGLQRFERSRVVNGHSRFPGADRQAILKV